MSTRDRIVSKCNQIKDLLLEKNEAYGDSALSPLNVFTQANAEFGIRQRIDDKLKRIQNVGLNDNTEDTLQDLVGYLILLMISRDERNNISGHQSSYGTHCDSAATSSSADPRWTVEGESQ